MKTIRFFALAALLAAAPAAAASRDALSLVPADATSVGFVRIADLRSNPFQLRVFEETDRLGADGDAARFLEDAGLSLRDDVDAVVACTTSSDGRRGRSLVFFQGRFDTRKLAAALRKRGAVRESAGGREYFRLKEDASDEHGPGAVALVDARLVVAGSQAAVLGALSDLARGGTRFSSGEGLGRELRRVDPAATAWVLVDVEKWRRAGAAPREDGPAAGVVSALKSVSLFTMQATVEGDALAVKATGLSADEETRELLEDALRGLTAAWRMAAQEKSPELVSAIRKFRVSRDDEGVTISGTLPGELIRSLSAEAKRRSGN
ncbi:MAG: hypothetical protein ACRD3M_10975 [Thermoanaerobaculia bacterium]